MKTTKIKTYFDKLMENKGFRDKFEREYKNLVISEKLVELRHKAHLTQEELAKRVHTTKSAISLYENNDYGGYSVSLLQKIAMACGADLNIGFVVRNNGHKIVI
jgi:DNA-binding XRE family transcriptional regulator